jgi:beta-barrel assembly-enhancing protease
MRSAPLVAIALAATLGACAAAKRLSEGDLTAADVTTAIDVVKKVQSLREEVRPDQEYYVGRSVATNILAQHRYRYLDREEISRGELAGLTRYVNKVGLVVSAAAMDMPRRKGDRPAPVAGWHFTVVEDDTVNAFAAPGGFVFVTTGAVKLARSEDELAGLLAHEIAHVLRGHALGNIKKSRYAGVSAELLQAAGTATLSPAQVNQLNQLLEGVIEDTLDALFVKGYSRDTELEADRLGVEIAARAGYDPAAMPRFLASLAERQDTGKGGFFATHPAAGERKRAIDGQLAGKPAVSVPQVRVERFLAAVAKVR